MYLIIASLIPAIALKSYFFGMGNLLQISIAIIVALLAEGLVLALRKRPVFNTLKDGSAILTAVLLGISIPTLAPWWVITIGTFFAIVFVKQLYGGLGQNLFNPAMAAYVLLLISFPVQMTSWLPELSLQPIALTFADQLHFIFYGISIDGYSLSQLSVSIDGQTMATPLNTVKNGLHSGLTLTEIANSAEGALTSASAIAWINIAFFLGGIVLFIKGVIHWHIPAAFLAGISLFSFIGFAFDPDLVISPLFHLFSGATMLGAFFILTDPVSAATTPKGRIIYAMLIALIVVIIRNIGGYPDAVAFAVLLGNMCVPLIDYYTKPRVYGSKQ